MTLNTAPSPGSDTDRLSPLIFSTMPLGTAWKGVSLQSSRTPIVRADGVNVPVDVPLFWHDPPWHVTEIMNADAIALAVARYGIAVSALRRDVSGAEGDSQFHTLHHSMPHDEPSDGVCELRSLPRIVPYRPERYGLTLADFDGASIIDVRLSANRDDSGRFAYSAAQIARWEATAAEQPLAGGAWVPSTAFPPDVPSPDKLACKLDQLRQLAPKSAVFVTLSPLRLDQELPIILKQKPDGVILDASETSLSGLALAAMTRRARQWTRHENIGDMPLWIVPGWGSIDDAAKLVALGASAVAIDHFANALVHQADVATDSSAAARLGYKSLRSSQDPVLVQLTAQTIEPLLDRFRGLTHALDHQLAGEALVSIDAAWAKALGVRHQSFGVTSA
jgi:hypothetical protein